MTKDHNFVKNMTIKNPKSHAHLQVTGNHSAKFQINLIKDVAGVAGTRSESARAITPRKMAKTKINKNSKECGVSLSALCHKTELNAKT